MQFLTRSNIIVKRVETIQRRVTYRKIIKKLTSLVIYEDEINKTGLWINKIKVIYIWYIWRRVQTYNVQIGEVCNVINYVIC